MSKRREMKRYLKKTSKKYPPCLVEIPYEELSEELKKISKHLKLLRSNKFLVQIYSEDDPCLVRLSICRTAITGKTWTGDITWDELMQIKRECGYEDFDALEVYPKDIDIINVTNMRHLFVMKEPVSFAWRNNP